MYRNALVCGVLVILMCAVGARAEPVFDDFEDGVIDSALWVTHGYKGGVGGVGAGDWQYSVDEQSGPDGYLQARVWGPTSGNSFGAEAWVRTVKDFNDGQQWLINFSWATTVGYTPHVDSFGVYISDKDEDLPDDCRWGWLGSWETEPRPGVVPLWRYTWDYGPGSPGPGTPFPSFLMQRWSILIQTDGTTSLYQRPNAQGSPFSTVSLDSGNAWHLGFVLNDATSSGFTAGDNTFRLYDFSAIPEPATLALLAIAGIGLLSRRRCG